MRSASRRLSALLLSLCLSAASLPVAAHSTHEDDSGCEGSGAACERGSLEPSYEPQPPAEPEIYTGKYYFATTRAVANSTIVPAGRVPLFFLTLPIDIVFLPVAAIAGFFPGD